MSCTAKDIMHPRVSLPAKEKGDVLLKKLMSPYPALPAVNDKLNTKFPASQWTKREYPYRLMQVE